MSVTTCSQKMVQIITNASLENKLISTLEKNDIHGYTIFNVRGDGDSGVQDSHIEGDTNILIMTVVPVDVSESLMSSLSEIKRRGHHLLVFSVEAAVLS